MQIVDDLLRAAGLKRRAKPVEHKLKWKILEGRFTAPVADADEMVFVLEKKARARFVGGGEYSEAVHAKEFGEGVFAYIMVRTDKKTEEETVVADAYMIQEEDIRLGLDVTSAYKIMENLDAMGYFSAFGRDYRVWRFSYGEVGAAVYDISDFGSFIEVAVPATNFPKARERTEKKAFELLDKIGLKKEDVIPADVITLQLMQVIQAAGNRPKPRRAI